MLVIGKCVHILVRARSRKATCGGCCLIKAFIADAILGDRCSWSHAGTVILISALFGEVLDDAWTSAFALAFFAAAHVQWFLR